ncbi:unnamed protein product [Vitrella brassicaformis CCMP3155]|uniref:Uncharacterized protein n=1 Tax=Vitrella brassicaformis (strain CCMP3155) TaxID=1169540 RepID=A0A0G4FY55_VITBC|nr:unnamed protein product [Vitrella brassicaformis CCMP3155]|eukprot:CEM20361.1 unnamed protein product [Vitrella brassicaformis CCMP3155]
MKQISTSCPELPLRRQMAMPFVTQPSPVSASLAEDDATTTVGKRHQDDLPRRVVVDEATLSDLSYEFSHRERYCGACRSLTANLYGNLVAPLLTLLRKTGLHIRRVVDAYNLRDPNVKSTISEVHDVILECEGKRLLFIIVTPGPLNGWRQEEALLKGLMGDGLTHGFITDGVSWLVVNIAWFDPEWVDGSRETVKRLYFEPERMFWLPIEPQAIMDYLVEAIGRKRKGDDFDAFYHLEGYEGYEDTGGVQEMRG